MVAPRTLPLRLEITMAIVEWIFIFSLAAIASLLILRATEANRKQKQLEEAFYYLLKSQDSCISLIQLAAAARVDAPLARQYLEQQVKAFGALPEVDADGDSYYRFPKLNHQLEQQFYEG